jgi:hypothetical protein
MLFRMADEYATKPTMETLLERMNKLEERLFIRLDRIEAEVKQTHSEVYALRADFTELRATIREHLPALK